MTDALAGEESANLSTLQLRPVVGLELLWGPEIREKSIQFSNHG